MTANNDKERYLRRTTLANLALAACGAAGFLFPPAGPAFAAGWIFAGLVAAAGLWLAVRALRKSRQFFAVLAASLLGKMAAYGVALGVVLGFSLFSRAWFAAGLLAGMLVFLALELVVFYRRGAWLLS